MDHLSPEAKQGTASREQKIINAEVETRGIREIKRIVVDICVEVL
jgi:hypothetical protein